MSLPMISIVVPNYNYAHYLPQCLDSVLAQTYPHWELIVVDDNSSDDSRRIVQSYQRRFPKKPIRLLHNHRGPSGTPTPVNIGLRAMRGRYFAWLSSDDIFLPRKLEEEAAVLQRHPEIGLVHTAFEIIDGQGRATPMPFPDFNAIPRHDFLPLFLECNRINGNTVLIQRELFDRLGLFEQSWPDCRRVWMVSEVLKWFEITLHSRVHFLPQVLHQARIHDAKSPVTAAGVPRELMGLIVEEFLRRNSHADFRRLLPLRGPVREACFIARCLRILTAYGRACAVARRMEELRRENPALHARVDAVLAAAERVQTAAHLAHMFILRNGGFAELRHYPLPPAGLPLLDEAHLFHLGSALKKGGDLRRAGRAFGVLTGRGWFVHPVYQGGAHFHLGEMALAAGERAVAEEHFHRCLKIMPEHKRAAGYLSGEAHA